MPENQEMWRYMYRILIIEDDKDIREALRKAGDTAGADVHEVDRTLISKGKADEAYRIGTYDAVVVGGYFHEAHVQNGHYIVERIRLRDRKVIIVGTAGDPNRRTAFLAAGASAFEVRGSTNRPAIGVLAALELLRQRDEKPKRTRKRAQPTPNQK